MPLPDISQPPSLGSSVPLLAPPPVPPTSQRSTVASLTQPATSKRLPPSQSVTKRYPSEGRVASEYLTSADSTLDSSARGARVADAPAKVPPTLAKTHRNSPNESQDTSPSDPEKWFDKLNKKAKAPAYQGSQIDLDPPWFQKGRSSSAEDPKDTVETPQNEASSPLTCPLRPPTFAPRPTMAHSSSAEDYRSVIDDLTIQNQRLKQRLKCYVNRGPDTLRKSRLFEVKVHGLSKRERRELEATLCQFAASLGESSATTPSSREKQLRRRTGNNSSDPFLSKQESAESWNSRPVDSAYASMLAGAASGTRPRPTGPSRTKSLPNQQPQKAPNNNRVYDTPDGLLPRRLALSEKQKKKLVVRRLEQLFTGKGGIGLGPALRHTHSQPTLPTTATTTTAAAAGSQAQPAVEGEVSRDEELSREAQIELRSGTHGKDLPRSRGNGLTFKFKSSRSRDNEGGGRAEQSGETNNSPQSGGPPEQRATKARDLDPDRIQIPAENLQYFRRLSLYPPDKETLGKKAPPDLDMDDDGWLYLNLLVNLAQLHMINVTPRFIQSAVAGMSSKFQLSPNGRKIRWLGGTKGTRFSSDRSDSSASHASPSVDDVKSEDGSSPSGQRKKRKTKLSAPLSESKGDAAPRVSTSSSSFHYKPMFVHRQSSSGQTSLDDTISQASFDSADDSNAGNNLWQDSPSGLSRPKKCQHDGAMIFYGRAPFWVDLSGDVGNLSPTSYLRSDDPAGNRPGSDSNPSGGNANPTSAPPVVSAPSPDASRPSRPLLEDCDVAQDEAVDSDVLSRASHDDSTAWGPHDAAFPCRDGLNTINLPLPTRIELEACGLGGTTPEDHLTLLAKTRRRVFSKRPRSHPDTLRETSCSISHDTADSVTGRLARLATTASSPPAPHQRELRSPKAFAVCSIEYLSRETLQLEPVRLPPPSLYYGMNGDSDSESLYISPLDSRERIDSEEYLGSSSDELISYIDNPHHSDNTCPEPGGLVSRDYNSDKSDKDGEGDDNDAHGHPHLDDHDRMDIDSVDDGSSAPCRKTSSRGGLRGRARLMHSHGSVATVGNDDVHDRCSSDVENDDEY